MNTEIQTFNFNNNPVRTLTDENGDPWFVDKDVCDILEISNNRDAISQLDSDEKNTVVIPDGIPGNPNKTIISEPGLYKLIMRSRKPEAKEFQRWVTHEVLPSIRKHDAHVAAQTLDNAPANHETTPQSFIFNGDQVRTISDENGNVLFCAKDVAKVLGYAHPEVAVSTHCKGYVIRVPLETTGGIQQVRFITEGDLYRLLVTSKLPTAERFERWVYDEVLPTIRKHGAYATEATIDQILSDPDFGIRLLTNLKEERAKRIEAENQVKELEPKAKALEDFTNVPDALLVRDAAKLLSNAGTPIGEKELREWLSQHGWAYRHAGTWWATSERVKAGHLVMVESRSHGQHKNGSIFVFSPTVKITRKGLALLHKRLGETRLNETLETTTH